MSILAPNGLPARRELALRDRYEGATYSTRRSYIPAAVQSARFDANAASRIELVRKARYFERNSPIVNRLADLFECYTVGTGLQVNPASSDLDWNARAQSWWDVWCQFPDLTSRQPFGTLQSLISRTWFVDGEILIVLTRGQSNLPRLQLIEGHLCATPPERRDQEGKTIIDGIGIDSNGRPRVYYISEDRGPGNPRTFKPVPAEFVIHVLEPGRPGQYRGLPYVYPVINTLHDLDDLQLLEIDAARKHAQVSEVIKTESGEIDPEDVMRGNTSQDADGKTRQDYYKEVIGADVKVLKWGDDFDLKASTRPSVVTRDFWRYLTQNVCAGVGIPYVLVYPDSMQGTVYRGALDMANSYFRARSAVLADVVRRIWEYVIGAARMIDRRIADPPADWMRVAIHPPRAVNVDVGRNSTALLAELAAGATTYQAHYSSLGRNWEREFDQVAQERSRMERLGIAPPGQQPAQEEEEPEEEEAVTPPAPMNATAHHLIHAGPVPQGRQWFEIRAAAEEDATEILIYAQIGKGWFDEDGVGAREFAEGLKAIPRDRQIRVRINSPGGNVHDGLAIYNQLSARRDQVMVIIDGVAASIASIVALAGRELQMPKNALYMLHDPSGLVMGTAWDMRQMADVLDKHRDALAGIYADRTGIPRSRIIQMMADETWMTGEEAFEEGFADVVTEEVQIAAQFDLSCFRRVPAALKQPATPNGAHQPPHPMNKKLRNRILSLLNAANLGAQSDATDEALLEQFANYAESISNSQRADQALKDQVAAIAAEVAELRRTQPTPSAQSTAAAATTQAQAGTQAAGTMIVDSQADPRILALTQSLENERRARITAQVDPLLAQRPYLNRATWIDRIMANEAALAELRGFPIPTIGADPVAVGIQNSGNPLLEQYRQMRPGAARSTFHVENFAELRRVHREFAPQAANTIAAALVPDFLADAMIVVATNKLAALGGFSTDFGTDPLAPRSTVQVRRATTGSAAQTNPTNFETGDSTLAASAVTVNQVSKSFHILNNELNSGHRLQHLAGINANIFANAISDVYTALLIAANYPTPLVIGVATAFDSADLPPIWAAAKDYKAKNLMLDGGHLAYLLPTTRENFRFGESGAFGFDSIAEQNRWTGAVANTVGFVSGPEAIAVASGMPMDLPAGEFLQITTIQLPNGLTIQSCVWFSRAGRVHWASYDVMFGAAVGDATQGEILVTA